MDHFPLPKGKAHLRIPNLTLGVYTRGPGDFEGYPSRMGWTAEEVAGHSSFGRRPREEVQSFFQNWLYFGCAVEVLAVAGVHLEPSDLVDETGRFVSTRRLPRFIRQMAQPAALILKRVSVFVDTYCLPRNVVAASSGGLGTPSARPCSLTTTSAAPATTGAPRLCSNGACWAKGWCPMDVERSMVDMGIDGHYYLTQMERPEGHISHESCNSSQCTARNVDRETYCQKHVSGESDCGGGVAADMAAVISIIETPAAYLSSVRRGFSDPPFVCISHVWSDGLGNLDENSLLECQLDRIQNAVDAVAQSKDIKGHRRPEHFWLDTLCVPVGAVLVLSSTLEAVASTDSEHDIGLAFYLANWNRRLWTTQEGMLTKVIMVQFADRPVNNDDILYPDVDKSVASDHCVTFPREAGNSIIGDFVVLRDFLRDDLFAPLGLVFKRLGPLTPAIGMVKMRSTSWWSDETICFDLELAKRRMRTFLSMVKVFPRDIIFNTHRRLDEEGFRRRRSYCGLAIGLAGYRSGDHENSSLELKITIIEPKITWKAATEYGVILDQSPTELARMNVRRARIRPPIDRMELELWFEGLHQQSDSNDIVTADAVVGYTTKPSIARDTRIQIQHACIAIVTFLNPFSVSHGSETDSSWETDDDEEDGDDYEDGPDLLTEEDLSDTDSALDSEGEGEDEVSGDDEEGDEDDDSLDSEYLDPIATDDFIPENLSPSEPEDSEEPEPTSEQRLESHISDELGLGPETSEKSKAQEDYETDEVESDPEVGDGEELHMVDEWGFVLEEGPHHSEGSQSPGEGDIFLAADEVGTYIEEGTWFIV
ncbi:hypothetical protein MFIFM68171_08210 [Madurella fahalii]|uniref:Heterokaryon incompatibility domain-containing protein n=1 Tax=Madurella fahalii TaxID=1157608 RepID=A0ABQ0GKB7_9PEZI